MNNEQRAVVREIGGQVVLDDPDAVAMIRAIAKGHCRLTLNAQADRVAHFKQRIVDRGLTPSDVVIVVLNMNDAHGAVVGDALMPGNEATWEAMRDAGEVPFARGLAGRAGIEAAVASIDCEEGERLRAIHGAAIVVMDYGVVAVFDG